jgi:transcriptional regulator with XRE-family HTH domain
MYGNKLKWLIKNKGFSQREIAAALDISESTLSYWTHMPYPSVESIEAICNILKIPISRFFVDLDNDSTVEITPQEARLLKIFNEFPEEKREAVLRILEGIREL